MFTQHFRRIIRHRLPLIAALALFAAGPLPAAAQTLFGGGSAAPTATPTPTPTPPPLINSPVTLDQLIPAATEVMISLNLRELVDSGMLNRVMTACGKQQEFEQSMAGLEAMVGSNPLRDISRVRIFGRVNDDQNVGLIAEGRFDRARLLSIIRVSPQYKEESIGIATIHQWFDAKDKVLKFGTFLNEQTMVIWNSEDAYKASIAAAQDPAVRLDINEVLPLLPEGAEDLSGWATLITRRTTCPGAKLQVKHAVALMDVQGDQLTMELRVKAATPQADAQWRQMLGGALAFGQLQRDNQLLAETAAAVRLTDGEGGASRLTLSVDPAALVTRMQALKQ